MSDEYRTETDNDGTARYYDSDGEKVHEEYDSAFDVNRRMSQQNEGSQESKGGLNAAKGGCAVLAIAFVIYMAVFGFNIVKGLHSGELQQELRGESTEQVEPVEGQ